MAAARDRMVASFARRHRPPGPPQFAKHPMQDDYGNPITPKTPLTTMFPARSGARETKHSPYGRFKPSPYRGKTGQAARKARAKKRGY